VGFTQANTAFTLKRSTQKARAATVTQWPKGRGVFLLQSVFSGLTMPCSSNGNGNGHVEQEMLSLVLPNLLLSCAPALTSPSFLVHIDLSHNAIIKLDLPLLPCLQHLNVSHNQLIELPHLKTRTPKLAILLVSSNCLSVAVDELPITLRQLDLSHNANLTDQHLVPLACMPGLKIVNLSGLHQLTSAPTFTSTQLMLVLPRQLVASSGEWSERDLGNDVTAIAIVQACVTGQPAPVLSNPQASNETASPWQAVQDEPTTANGTRKRNKKKKGRFDNRDGASDVSLAGLQDLANDPDFAVIPPTSSHNPKASSSAVGSSTGSSAVISSASYSAVASSSAVASLASPAADSATHNSRASKLVPEF
jgi:hypothetical protein